MAHILPEIEKQKPQYTAWRRHFHRHPEPSLKEYQTADTIRAILTEFGIPYDVIGETGTLATINGTKTDKSGNQSDHKVLLRADIDALEITEKSGAEYSSETEGLMHACGHDAHTTALLGAAEYLTNHRADFGGTVVLAFQQAEEIGAGAKKFIESGLINDVDVAFGMHVDPATPVGKAIAVSGANNASCDIFTIEVEGKSSHVARPHQGVDALLAGANIVTELQNLVARQTNPLEPAVIGIGKFESGTRYNIVANHAKIEGTLRTLSNQARSDLLAKIEHVAKATASIHGAKIKFSNYAAAAPVINDASAAARAQKVASSIFGSENVIRERTPSMGADDFADYQLMIPGVYSFVGVNSSPETSFGIHHECFNLDEDVLPLMVNYHVGFALDYLNEK